MSESPSGVFQPSVKFLSSISFRPIAARRIVFTLALLLAVPLAAQISEDPKPPDLGRPSRHTGTDIAVTGRDNFHNVKLLGRLNAERQKSMVSDADKLLRLAQELNAELARGDGGAPTPQQAHKAAEIEKLARNVREKMSYAAGMSIELNSPFNASMP
jgi:hypothetical protein